MMSHNIKKNAHWFNRYGTVLMVVFVLIMIFATITKYTMLFVLGFIILISAVGYIICGELYYVWYDIIEKISNIKGETIKKNIKGDRDEGSKNKKRN